MGLFRPSMGDRMDAAQERQFRRRQKEEDLRLEQAQRRHEDAIAKRDAAEAKLNGKYRGK